MRVLIVQFTKFNISINYINIDCTEYVVKAQILAGGRGKGIFDNGFQGGVHLTTR